MHEAVRGVRTVPVGLSRMPTPPSCSVSYSAVMNCCWMEYGVNGNAGNCRAARSATPSMPSVVSLVSARAARVCPPGLWGRVGEAAQWALTWCGGG